MQPGLQLSNLSVMYASILNLVAFPVLKDILCSFSDPGSLEQELQDCTTHHHVSTYATLFCNLAVDSMDNNVESIKGFREYYNVHNQRGDISQTQK